MVAVMVASAALMTACSSGDSSSSEGSALDQAGACDAWATYLASPVSAVPNPPTAMESDQFLVLSDAYGAMAAELAPVANNLDGSVDPALQDAMGRAASTTADISSVSATVADTLAESDLESLIPLMDTYSAQIDEITALCTSP